MKQRAPSLLSLANNPIDTNSFSHEKYHKTRTLTNIQFEKSMKLPLKILSHKMSVNPSKKYETIRPKISEAFNLEESNQFQREHKKILSSREEPKDHAVQRKTLFNRFHYENYENYRYLGSSEQKKYPLESKTLQETKSSFGIGFQKNLEIVFCEHKYKDFVQKTNNESQRLYETKKVSLSSHKRALNPKSETKEKEIEESKSAKSLVFQAKKRKTTLANHLKEFNTLEKLSQFMENEHKFSEKYFIAPSADSSKTVLVDIVVHRYEFLKKMKKKARDSILKIILGEDELTPVTKMNIQDYIKFVQLLISRDAESTLVAMFLFMFLFESEDEITKEAVFKTLNLLEGSATKHRIVESKLCEIIKKSKGNADQTFNEMKQNEHLLNLIVDLIVEN